MSATETATESNFEDVATEDFVSDTAADFEFVKITEGEKEAIVGTSRGYPITHICRNCGHKFLAKNPYPEPNPLRNVYDVQCPKCNSKYVDPSRMHPISHTSSSHICKKCDHSNPNPFLRGEKRR